MFVPWLLLRICPRWNPCVALVSLLYHLIVGNALMDVIVVIMTVIIILWTQTQKGLLGLGIHLSIFQRKGRRGEGSDPSESFALFFWQIVANDAFIFPVLVVLWQCNLTGSHSELLISLISEESSHQLLGSHRDFWYEPRTKRLWETLSKSKMWGGMCPQGFLPFLSNINRSYLLPARYCGMFCIAAVLLGMLALQKKNSKGIN